MSFELLGVVVLSIVLGVVLFAYERSVREIAKLRRERSEDEKRARQEAMKLVKEAREKAVEIVGEAKVDATKWQQIMDQEMEKLASGQLTDYKEKLQEISKGIEEEVKTGAEDFRKVLEMETVGAEKTVAKKVEDKYSLVEKEIEDYRLEKMKEIEAKANQALEGVVKKVFAKAVKVSGQEELIIEALDEAKRENAI